MSYSLLVYLSLKVREKSTYVGTPPWKTHRTCSGTCRNGSRRPQRDTRRFRCADRKSPTWNRWGCTGTPDKDRWRFRILPIFVCFIYPNGSRPQDYLPRTCRRFFPRIFLYIGIVLLCCRIVSITNQSGRIRKLCSSMFGGHRSVPVYIFRISILCKCFGTI